MSLLNSIISFAVALHPATDNDCKTAATTDVASIASSSSSESDYETCSESEEEEEGESASIGILPPELVRQVLGQAALDRYEWFVVEGQLERIETQCRSCTFRSLALVCHDWYTIAREIFHQDIAMERREWDEVLVERLRSSSKMAMDIRGVDVSLRARNNELPDLIPVSATSVMVEAREREVAAGHERERQLFLHLLELCPLINKLDIDIGYHYALRNVSLFPTALRTLTLRNVDATSTLEIVNSLPLLTDLTLRLVLDWYADANMPLATCQLSRFELSITGWGETDTKSILRLLAGSEKSLRSLTLRNKGAVSVRGFLPIASDLIAKFAPQLTELNVKDIPNNGKRARNEKPLDWFPSRMPSFPRLSSLHLTGLSYSPSFFISLKLNQLASLTIESFDEPTVQPLLESLRATNTGLSALKHLRVASSFDDGENAGKEAWAREGQGAVEEWCEENECQLLAGWVLRRLERRWW